MHSRFGRRQTPSGGAQPIVADAKDRGRLFLVDPFADESDLYRMYLGAHGWLVEAYDSPEMALVRALQDVPDVVVARIRQFSGHISGIALAASLRASTRTKGVPIVIITTSILPDEHDAARRAGANRCLLLPLTPADLLVEVRALVSHSAEA